MEVGEVKARLTADVSDLQSQFDDARRRIDALAHDADASFNGTAKSVETSFNDITGKTGKLAKSAQATLEESAKAAEAKMAATGTTIAKVGAGLTTVLTPAAVGLEAYGVSAFKTAVKFESSFAGVKKTMEGTKEDFAALEVQIRQLSKEIPVSANALNKIAENAGALGVQKEALVAFTKTVAQMATSTNLTADAAANAFARIGSLLHVGAEDYQRLGATIVDLGNKGSSTEKDIVAMSLRIAGAASAINLSAPDVAGFSASLANVGISAEAGGTAFSKLITNMARDVATGKGHLAQFAKTADMSEEEFTKSFKTDAAGTIVAFVQGLGHIKDAGGDLNKTLDGLGANEVRYRDMLGRMAASSDGVAKSIKDSRDAWEQGTALAEEAGKRYETTASQMEMFSNKMEDVSLTVGQALIPAFKRFLVAVTPLVDKLAGIATAFSELDPVWQTTIGALIVVTGVIGPLTAVVGLAVIGLGTMLGPIALAGGAIIGLAAAATVLYLHWDDFKKKAVEIWTDVKAKVLALVKGIRDDVTEWLITKFSPITDSMKKLTTGIVDAWSWAREKISGHSIVPDMVDEVTAEFERQDQTVNASMDHTVESITDKMDGLKANMSGGATSMSSNTVRAFQAMNEDASFQLQEFRNSAIFTWGSIRTSFVNATVDMMVGQGTFKDFLKASYKTILAAILNYTIEAGARHVAMYLLMDTAETAHAAVHATTEGAKTAATVTGETARVAVTVATNKIMLAGITSVIVGIGAMGNAALALVGIMVTAVAAAMYAMASGVAFIPVIGQAAAGGLIAGATLVEIGGAGAVAGGLAALNVALGTAIVTSTAALATPFAEGGVVSSPTFAMLGERGREAVVPLDKASGFGGGQTITIYLDKDVLMRHVSKELVPSLRMRGLPA